MTAVQALAAVSVLACIALKWFLTYRTGVLARVRDREKAAFIAARDALSASKRAHDELENRLKATKGELRVQSRNLNHYKNKYLALQQKRAKKQEAVAAQKAALQGAGGR